MKTKRGTRTVLFAWLWLVSWVVQASGPVPADSVFPGAEWQTRTPEEVGLDPVRLEAIAGRAGGRGCVVRHGYLVYAWGDPARRGDVASAAKPWYSHFLFLAVEEGLLPGVDASASEFEPRLKDINADLGRKDSSMTFRHLAQQTACYGVREAPGTAFVYNDWQMALFFDVLFLKVYGSACETVDAEVLRPKLTDILQCQDDPTFMAFGVSDRPGRLAISPRDFARFGLLYLREGLWDGRQVIDKGHARLAVSEPLPNSIPRTFAQEAEMIPGARSLGSQRIPDDQGDHRGSYSWLWWTNGVDREGRRHWPDAPSDTFAALGHGGVRGMAVVPSLDVVISWNDTRLGDESLNGVFKLLSEAATDEPLYAQIIPDPNNAAWLVYNRDQNRDGLLDPFFMCGPGDPEDFLYRGRRNPDGTRTGDQLAIINKLIGTGANCLYFQAVRSHGGDGDDTHNPFVDSDPTKRLDEMILNQWETWFSLMDRHGIVIFFFFYDDSARLWDTGDSVGAGEKVFLEGIVKRFAHHKHLIWCVAEEYEEAFTPARVKKIAEIVREADKHNHVIAVHKHHGIDFDEFAEDPHIDQFAVQYNVRSPLELHNGVRAAWTNARGRYNVNMSEATEFGFSAQARKKFWACAMAGSYAMALGWTFETDDEPSVSDLEGCGRLVKFFERTNFNEMAPHDELRLAGTEYLLALPGHSYVAYASQYTEPLGIREMTPGRYTFAWLDAESGATSTYERRVSEEGDFWVEPPPEFKGELAVWIRKVGAPER